MFRNPCIIRAKFYLPLHPMLWFGVAYQLFVSGNHSSNHTGKTKIFFVYYETLALLLGVLVGLVP